MKWTNIANDKHIYNYKYRIQKTMIKILALQRTKNEINPKINAIQIQRCSTISNYNKSWKAAATY